MDKKLKELMELSKNNPDLEIQFMANYEIAASDECNYWCCDISRIDICEYFCPDERVYFDKEIYDHLANSLCNKPFFTNLDNEDFEKAVNNRIEQLKEGGEITQKIIVYLDN